MNDKWKQLEAKTFKQLVHALYEIREVRNNKTLLPLSDKDKEALTRIHKELDDMVERLENTGIEKRLYKELVEFE